jgi:hypothetical protein
MRAHEIIPQDSIVVESPQMVGDTDFNLTDDAHNEKLAAELIRKEQELLEDSDDYRLFLTGNKVNGYICLVDKEPTPQINYLVRYQAKNFKAIGSTVTQVAIWRRDSGPGVIGITDKVFGGYLLKNYDAVVSDMEQTALGRKFWVSQMNNYSTKGYKVGLMIQGVEDIQWFDRTVISLKKWLASVDGWGTERKYTARRFIISN